MMPQQYCLRWKHHHSNVQNMFAQLLEKERFCDVTLYCSPSFATQVPDKDTIEPHNIRGVSLRAHRVVLASCSELLGALLGAHESQGEPVLVIDGASPSHLRALLSYMYTGEMNVHHSQLASLLKTAEELRIKGLTDIRWNNKDEPPDCDPEVVTVATPLKKSDSKPPEKQTEAKQVSPMVSSPKQGSPMISSPKQVSPKHLSPKHSSPKHSSPKHSSPKPQSPKQTDAEGSLKPEVKPEEYIEVEVKEKINVNGGPPPLIKLPTKEKLSPLKRELSDSDSPSPKRQRLPSNTEHTDDESASHSNERDSEWQHGNLDISAERVVHWGGSGNWSRDPSDDEWTDACADIGSFLDTRLKVQGDNSGDEESNDSAGGALSVASAAASSSASVDNKIDLPGALGMKLTIGPKSGPTDPRFPDVIKLSDYLQHGRRPQFWEETYVKRVMEAVRMKELEMKQAAEILGVSYGTLYGRYRDVYGCINRPYRTARDFWQAKGPSEVLDRLQRGDISVEAASLALGVGVNNLAAYMSADINAEKGRKKHVKKRKKHLVRSEDIDLAADSNAEDEEDFDPIPIEVDPSLKVRRTYTSGPAPAQKVVKKTTLLVDKSQYKKIMIGSLTDDDPIPATVIATSEATTQATNSTSGKWPTIRVASLDTLRAEPTSPSALMRTRPDLTIVAAKKEKDDA